MMDIDFPQIVPRGGSQRDSFEELCCQLAHRTLPADIVYRRLRGAGGDGGVECFAELPDGSRTGWQAKYVFDIDALLTQATDSLTTAIRIHSTLTRYIVCFPFDLTGPTGRRGLSGQEKLDAWKTNHEAEAAKAGRQLKIDIWPEFTLRQLLLQHDASGGVREFFFNQRILTTDWFTQHLERAKSTAGPRYTPELNIKTDLWKWFAAFGRNDAWRDEFNNGLLKCRQQQQRLASDVNRSSSDTLSPVWPEALVDDAQILVSDITGLLDECARLVTSNAPQLHKSCVDRLASALGRLRTQESNLAEEFEAKHGQGAADSPGIRQFMAEYQVSFPAANLDHARDAITILSDFYTWLTSPACSLAYEPIFVLSGDAGVGKTHGVCDAANRRLRDGHLTCVVFGHEFRGEPEPWVRLSEILGIPTTIGMNGLLDVLNAAGEASGVPLILCIDAINETKPLRYWKDRLSAFAQAVQQRQYLRLCITCRTSFLPFCIPDKFDYMIVEHSGFVGIEHDATAAFFAHYDLEPPITPILQPEMSNPLYLRLLCETLRSRGLQRLPSGWSGISPVIRAFLEEKERQFTTEHETSPGASIVRGSLMAIARAIAELGVSSLSWSQAQQVITAARPLGSSLPVLQWLVRADLLIEDVPIEEDPIAGETVLRPGFERLGEFLVATELLERCNRTALDDECQPGGTLFTLLKDAETVERNGGVLAALAVLIPEKYSGIELPNLVNDDSTRSSLLRVAVQVLPSRDPNTFTATTSSLILEALSLRDFAFDAMDAVLASAWQPSEIDAIWLNSIQNERPLAKRDAFWCSYLHTQFETNSNGTIRRLIDAALQLPLSDLQQDIAERWSIILLWFAAAADRRIKDRATRAAIAILVAQPKVMPETLERFIACNDDEVRERVILSCYGAAIITRDVEVVEQITELLYKVYLKAPLNFNNAMIRDHIRCISELALELGVLPKNYDPELTMQPIASEWPLELPSEEQAEEWGDIIRFKADELMSDFYNYSMNCLRPWQHSFSKLDMVAWIIQRIARDFGYIGSRCERYDQYMLGKYGGGRGKPDWAERIGKKYQWVAMYQLASRLHDHINRERESWEPEPARTQLIIVEERKLDPTLPSNIVKGKSRSSSWWITSTAGLGANEIISDEEWVAKQDDIPTLESLLSIVEHEGRNWQLLVSYPSWNQREEGTDWDAQYRDVWINIESYLVNKKDIAVAYNSLRRRNFFGKWMPEGVSLLYGFAGEYPWATSFNTEPEESSKIRKAHRHGHPIIYQPTWNRVVGEWEYDASIPGKASLIVPARPLFSLGDLWWDGLDGYRLINGRTVYRDPSATETGPASLLADAKDLLERLDRLGLQLVWTLLGEKLIIGGFDGQQRPRQTFSQVAYLDEGGSLQVGEQVFFKDYGQDTGPREINEG